MLFDTELCLSLACLTLDSQDARASASAARPMTTSGAPETLTLTESQLVVASPMCNPALALASMASEVLNSSGTSSISLPAFSASTTSECSLARQQHRPPFNSPASPLAALQQQRRQEVARTKRQRSRASQSASDARWSGVRTSGKRAHLRDRGGRRACVRWRLRHSVAPLRTHEAASHDAR